MSKMMTTEEFKELYFEYGKNSMTAAIIGASIGVVGCVFMLAMGFNIYGAAAFGFLGCMGLLGYYKNVQHKKSIENGQNPLIQGIESGNSSYLKWFYVTILTHKKNIKALEFKTYYINAYDDKKIVLDLSMEDEEQCNRIIELLASKFPNAQTGYSEEIRQKMIQKYNYKGHAQKYVPKGK